MNPALSSLSAAPAPDFVQRLSRLLQEALDRSGWRFSCENSEFESEEMAAPDGMLPMWLNRAQEWMAKSLGGNAGAMAYRIDGAALCGVRPEPQGPTASLATWACYLHFAVEQWRAQHLDLVRRGQAVPMDEIYRDWHAVVRQRAVPLLPPQPAPGMEMELAVPTAEPQRAGAGG